MTPITVKTLCEAHTVCGNLRGMSEAVKFWRPEDVTQELIDRLRAHLSDLRAKSERVANAVSEQAEGGVK